MSPVMLHVTNVMAQVDESFVQPRREELFEMSPIAFHAEEEPQCSEGCFLLKEEEEEEDFLRRREEKKKEEVKEEEADKCHLHVFLRLSVFRRQVFFPQNEEPQQVDAVVLHHLLGVVVVEHELRNGRTARAFQREVEQSHVLSLQRNNNF